MGDKRVAKGVAKSRLPVYEPVFLKLAGRSGRCRGCV